jgi:hypothetical protein
MECVEEIVAGKAASVLNSDDAQWHQKERSAMGMLPALSKEAPQGNA